MNAQAVRDDRLVVETMDADGRVVQRFVGPSGAELLAMHERGECSATCSHCHQALANEIGEDAALRSMYESTFNKRAPWA